VHQPIGLDELGGVNFVTFPLSRHAGLQGFRDRLIVGFVFSEEFPEVGLFQGKETVPELAIGGQA
jgi:hypothetical protein